MKLKNFVEGLNILHQYYNGGDGYHIGAEHDQFYAYKTDVPLTPEDVQKMLDLDWFQPERTVDVPTVSDYDPDDGWSAMV